MRRKKGFHLNFIVFTKDFKIPLRSIPYQAANRGRSGAAYLHTRNKFFVSLDAGNYNTKRDIKWINGLFAKLLLFRCVQCRNFFHSFVAGTCYDETAPDSFQEYNHKIFMSHLELVCWWHNYTRRHYTEEIYRIA